MKVQLLGVRRKRPECFELVFQAKQVIERVYAYAPKAGARRAGTAVYAKT